MKTSTLVRHLFLASVLLPGCGGDGGKKTNEPPPEDGGGAGIPVPEADLEAECRAATRRWKTIRVVYKAEGANPTTVTLAAEQGGRIVLRADPGPGMVLDGGWCHFREPGPGGAFFADRAPIGYVFAAALAIDAKKPVPPRGDPPPLPPHHVLADLALSLDPNGQAARRMSFIFGLTEIPAFGWMSSVRVAEGVTVRADGKIAVSQGPAGRITIDRATGVLLDWVLEPPEGRSARLRAETVETDLPLDAALFRLEGTPAPRELSRQRLLYWTLSLMGQTQAQSAADQEERLRRYLQAYYRAAWTQEDIAHLAELAAARKREAARKLREEHPEATADDIEAASGRTAMEPIQAAMSGPLGLDVEIVIQAHGAETREGKRLLAGIVLDAAGGEVATPAMELCGKK